MGTTLSSLHIRGPRSRDLAKVKALLKKYNCTNVEDDSLKQLALIVDDNDEIVAVGTISNLIDVAFVVDDKFPKRQRVKAMKMLMDVGDSQVKKLGHNCFHVFVHNPLLESTLKKHFGFVDSVGKDLIRWIKTNG
jgi:hypothetical protein